MRGSEIHHRQRRREGGHGYENLVLLCGTCHRWAHKYPLLAKADGYIVDPSETDISSVPIDTFVGVVRFTIDGGATLVTTQEETEWRLQSASK